LIPYRILKDKKIILLSFSDIFKGSDENPVSDIPAVAAYLQGSSLDWQFKTEPQPTACLGLVGKLFGQNFCYSI
jgi:hypothetical protein